MAVYVGVMDKGTKIVNSHITGDSIEVLCTPVVNENKEIVGPRSLKIDSSLLELVDCFSANEQYPGFSIPRNYREVLREVSARQRVNESVVALFTREAMPVDCFLCGDYPRDELVYVARVSGGLVETLEQVGRRF